MTRLLKWLVLLNFVALTIYVGLYISGRVNQDRARREQIRKIGSGYQSEGIESQAEYIKGRDIQSSIIRSGVISDSDLDWTLDFLRRRPAPLAQSNGLLSFALLRNIPPDQKDKIYAAAVTCVQTKDPEDWGGLRPIYSFRVFEKLKDPRATAVILPWVDDPRPRVNGWATRALRALGYRFK